MTDIVERLRGLGKAYGSATCREAADEIERLRGLLSAIEEELLDDDVAGAQLMLKHRHRPPTRLSG